MRIEIFGHDLLYNEIAPWDISRLLTDEVTGALKATGYYGLLPPSLLVRLRPLLEAGGGDPDSPMRVIQMYDKDGFYFEQ
jgi:hypothetical protein